MTYGTLTNYQTGFGYKSMNGWYARSYSTGRVYVYTPKLNLLKRD